MSKAIAFGSDSLQYFLRAPSEIEEGFSLDTIQGKLLKPYQKSMRTSLVVNAVRVNFTQLGSSSSVPYGSGNVVGKTTVGSAAVLALVGFSLSTFSLKQLLAKSTRKM